MRDWTSEELYHEQLRLEKEAHDNGITKYCHKIQVSKEKSTESSTKPVHILLVSLIEKVANEIVTRCDNPKASRSGIAEAVLKTLNSKIVAMIALRVILDGITQYRPMTALACSIGERIEDEARFEALDKKDMKRIMPHLKHTSSYKYRHVTANKFASVNFKDDWKNWHEISVQDKKLTFHVGAFLIDCIISSTDIIYAENIMSQKSCHETKTIKPKPEIVTWIQERNMEFCELFPQHLPTVIPPKPWTDFYSGGYYTNYIPQLPFVKTRWPEHKIILRDPKIVEQMHEVYEAVNHIQSTAWRINVKALETLEALFFDRSLLANLPYQCEDDPPVCPVCHQAVVTPHACFETNKDALGAWKSAMFEWHKKIIINNSIVELVSRTISIARAYKDYPAIYFPCNCDFRGRIYSIPATLHPQGADYAKGLLEFAEGKRIETPEQLKWLQIAGANHYGGPDKLDKAPFTVRCQWVNEHTDLINAIASDPIGNIQWTDADEPWQFLAWCIDYAEYLKDPEHYESHAVVAMDGSCNGLQHFSALLRDEAGAKAVNLAAADKPSDIYGIVAAKVVEKMQKILSEPAVAGNDKSVRDHEMATRWLAAGITRKTTKRSVMVVPYSGTQIACREYIQEYLKDKYSEALRQATIEHPETSGLEIKDEIAKSFPFSPKKLADYDFFKAATWLARYVWEAIGETIVSAKQAMSALQEYARVAARVQQPVCWTTPSGFVVWQGYKDMRMSQLTTVLQDTTCRLLVATDDQTICLKQQANGISPNFIHSLDATALVKTVNAAPDIKAFAMVHDSYGTHAADAPELARILREQFIKLYTDQDPLADLWKDSKFLDTKGNEMLLPPLPAKGNFDINKVSSSQYFFA